MKGIVMIVLLFAMSLSVVGKEQAVETNPQYLILDTHRTTTLQKELDAAAKRGYRAVAAMPAKDEAIILLERLAQPAEPYTYRLLATYRTSTMEKELNEAGRNGYRLLPQTTFKKGDELIVILERGPKTDQRYEYRLLATYRTSTIQKELNEARQNDFLLRGTVDHDEKMVVLERPSRL